MRIGKVLSGLIPGAVTLALLPAAAQRPSGTIALTADDHVQIQQLVMRFGYALDTGAGDGAMFADLFAADGVYGAANGRSELAALARTRPDGAASRHFVTNVIVQSSERGAIGTQYEVMFVVGQGGSQSTITRTGRYEDTYTKTTAGWRIQKREFFPSISTPEADKAAVPEPPRSGPQPPVIVERQRPGTPTALTALDYLEIQRLVASYGHALDNGVAQTDNGPAYAGLFTPDGVAFRRLQGFGPLAAIARAQPHGPKYVRHFLTNVTIAPSPEGATGEQYLVVIDPPEGGKPGRLFLGGHYEDIYVKSAEGWRYKSRTLFNANLGAEAPSALPPSEPVPAAMRVATANRTSGAAAFTSEDYVEIQQLVARYAFALDTADNNGFTYADLFATDGTFNDTKGRDALAALPRGPRRGPLYVRNYGAVAIIQPTPAGATGIQYAQAMDFEPGGRKGVLDHFGHYEDVYVRTAQGWRFKSRRFVNESQAALKASTVRELTGQDRADIQELVANYARALSSCASREYASLFVSDGVFISDDFRGTRHRAMYGPNGGKLVGRAQLAELVETEDFCLDKSTTRAARPVTTPNVVIIPTADGATGTIALANDGRYEDEYLKTPEGWRFKTRKVVMPKPTR